MELSRTALLILSILLSSQFLGAENEGEQIWLPRGGDISPGIPVSKSTNS